MKHSVTIYSRIGELMQGILPDASGFLISGLPSRLFYSEAVLEEGGTTGAPGGTTGAPGGTAEKRGPAGMNLLPPKAQQAMARFLEAYNDGSLSGSRWSVRLHSNIPAGKGLSSSSTDILSVLSVVNHYLQAGRSNEELYRIAASVEPTDPCLSDDIVVFKQNVGIIDRCISLPPMEILYFDADPHRVIDTEKVQRTWTPGAGKFFDWLLRKFERAAEAGDYDMLFDSITYSAEYNQTVLSIPHLDEYLQLARKTQSGLMVAHSGTIVGLLTRTGQSAELRSRLETGTGVRLYSEEYPLPISAH